MKKNLLLAAGLMLGLSASAQSRDEKIQGTAQDAANATIHLLNKVDAKISVAQDQVAKAGNELDKVAEQARDSFLVLSAKTLDQGYDAVAKRYEYIYLTALYADIISARYVGDLTDSALNYIGAPEFMRDAAAKGVDSVVLLAPSTVVLATEIQNRFKRVGYIVPATGIVLGETINVLGALKNNITVGGGKFVVNYAELFNAAKTSGLRLAKVGGATIANYGVIGGAMYLSYESATHILMPRAALTDTKRAIEARMQQLRSELPDIVWIDQTLDYIFQVNRQAIDQAAGYVKGN